MRDDKACHLFLPSPMHGRGEHPLERQPVGFSPLPLGEGTGVRAWRHVARYRHHDRLPSPPAPLPRAGEGSQPARIPLASVRSRP